MLNILKSKREMYLFNSTGVESEATILEASTFACIPKRYES